MIVGVENYWRFNGIKTPSMKGRTKVLASFEAGMNSPNLPCHVNITSLKHRSRFGEVPCFRHILSDRNKFAPRGEGENGGVQCPRGFSCFFFWWSVAPDLRSVKTILAGKLCSFSVYSPDCS